MSISTQTEPAPESEDGSEGGGLIGAVFILMNAVLGKSQSGTDGTREYLSLSR